MAWIAALIGAAGTYLSTQSAKKSAAKVGKQQDRLYGIQADTAERLQPYAFDFYRQSADSFGPALGYYKAVASGDRGRTLGALAPQFNQIGSRYRSTLQASRALNPRGGRSAAWNNELLYREGDEKQALLNAERSGAYGNLAKMAGIAGDLGAGAAGISTRAGEGAGSMLNNASLMQMMQSGKEADAYAEIGKALAGAWGAYKKRKD